MALAAGATMLVGVALSSPAAARGSQSLPRTPELAESQRLDDRRAVVTGGRFYSMSTAAGLYPAMGWHTRGEMGGFWSPPIKLLDGMWFAVAGSDKGVRPARAALGEALDDPRAALREKLDVTVYTIRGLRDLADMARSKGDEKTAAWASERADRLASRFEKAWWYGGSTDSYADSVDSQDDPANDNTKIFQRHWIGVTPMEALVTRRGKPDGPLASGEHARAALDEHERACYTGEFGLYHTGTGPTSAEGGNPGPACDDVVSSVPSERSIFTLGTSIMAVAEGNYGRMGAKQQQYYTTANARVQLDPDVWEQPGMMPEISPSPDFGPNIDLPFTERSMLLQAWGTYGVLWPVVHQQLGVSPDMGRDRLTVVPQVPAGQHRVAGSNIRLGDGSVSVRAARHGRVLRTVVDRHLSARLTIGHVLPDGAEVAAVRLDGRKVPYEVVRTARGAEVRVDAGAGAGRSALRVRLA